MRHRTTQQILLTSFVVALAYPLVSAYLIFPAFGELLIANSEDQAERIARHVRSMMADDGMPPLDHAWGEHEMQEVVEDFGLEKMRIYSARGEIVSSTDRTDIGRVNDRPYFKKTVASGQTYSKRVPKNARTQEGRVVDADVVETYVPIMREGRFAGAIEIYYDVAASGAALRGLFSRLSVLPAIMMFAFFAAVLIILLNADKPEPLPPEAGRPTFQSPLYFLAVAAFSIFTSAAAVQLLVQRWPAISPLASALVTPSLLVMLVVPLLFLLLNRPLLAYVDERRRMERMLLASEARLLEMSVTDQLTSLYNRRGFMALAGKQLKLSDRLESTQFLIYLDIDNFKDINDSYGHATGDLALREIATLLQSTYRESDLLARLGGDEFVALLAAKRGSEDEGSILHRFEEQLRRLNAVPGRRYQLRVSTGIVRCDDVQPCTIEALLTEADARMYAAKKIRRQQQNKAAPPTQELSRRQTPPQMAGADLPARRTP